MYLFFAAMGKKITLASKDQLRQALSLHASSKTVEVVRPLALEKGLGQPIRLAAEVNLTSTPCETTR